MQQPPPDNPDDLPCKVQIGFLFKRTCGRISRVGCQYCKGQAIPRNSNTWTQEDDPYFYDRNYYLGYGNYGGGWGSQSWSDRNDFTQGDSKSVQSAQDADFERDLGGS